MTWQFWKNREAPKIAEPQDIKWPTDAYESVKMLLGLYVKATPPFSYWRAPGVQFTPEVEETAELSARSYQLAIWFWMLGSAQGAIAARMARDAFCILCDELEDKTGNLFEALLALQDSAYAAYAESPPERRKIKTASDGDEAELPREYFVAVYMLLALDNSPYYLQENRDMRGDDFALAACLGEANSQAQQIFTPMLAAIGQFVPENFPKWKWSAIPGAHERHLQRRHNNPLFRLDRQTVTARDVYEARVQDTAALDAVRKEEAEIRTKLRETELPADWSGYLDQMREKLDALADRISRMGNAPDVQKTVAKLREYVIGIWHDTYKSYPEKLALLDKAEAAHAQRQNTMLVTEWLRQILHPDKVIPPDEIIPALLSEDIAALTAAVKVMESEPSLRSTMLLHVRTGALDVVRPALAAGHTLPDIAEKLSILGVAL